MLHPDGLEVVVRSVATGSQYQEYEKAGDTDTGNGKLVGYIEAINDEPFMIEAKIKPTFPYYSAEGVKIKTNIDNGVIEAWNFRPRPGKGTRRTDQIFTKYVSRRKVGDQWVKTGFAFGELRLGDDTSVDAMLLERQGSSSGKITVTIQRGNRKKREVSTEWSPGPEICDTASPKLLKQTKISHAMKLKDIKILKKPPRNPNIFKAISGPKLGKLFVFEFCYRSRASLERLEIATIGSKDVLAIDTAAVSLVESDNRQQIRAEDRIASPRSSPAQPEHIMQALEITQVALEGTSELLTEKSTSSVTVLTTAVKREVDEQPSISSTLRKRVKTIDLTADSPEPETPCVKPETCQDGFGSPAVVEPVHSTVHQGTNLSSVKQESGASRAISQAVERYDGNIDEEDLQMELRRIELEERRLNVQQRLKKLQKARAGRA